MFDEEETTVGGIILPDAVREKPQRAEVLAVGPGVRDAQGVLVPLEVEIGDTVYFSRFGGVDLKLDGEEFLLLRESDVLGVEDDASV